MKVPRSHELRYEFQRRPLPGREIISERHLASLPDREGHQIAVFRHDRQSTSQQSNRFGRAAGHSSAIDCAPPADPKTRRGSGGTAYARNETQHRAWDPATAAHQNQCGSVLASRTAPASRRGCRTNLTRCAVIQAKTFAPKWRARRPPSAGMRPVRATDLTWWWITRLDHGTNNFRSTWFVRQPPLKTRA